MPSYVYNGVAIELTQTLEFSWVMEYDPTETDALFTRYTIRVRGFITQGQGQFPGVDGTTASSSITVNAIKSLLQAPRRPMRYILGATPLLSVAVGTIDDKNGPIPLPAVVKEVSTGTFYVECGCVVRLVACDTACPDGSSRSPVISLRWTQTESFDENWNSNLTTDGKLIVRSSMLQCADNFRINCTPDIAIDYIRTRSSYTISPDGLEMDFHFEDQEMDRLPPFPATTATGTYVVTTPRPGGLRIGTVMIDLTAPKGINRSVLMYRAIRMAYAKLRADQLFKSKAPILWGEFKEDLFVPKVSISMSAMMTNLPVGATAGFTIGGINFGGAEAIPGAVTVMPSVGEATVGLSSGEQGIKPPDRKRIQGLLVANFVDPCLCNVNVPSIKTTLSKGSFATNSEMIAVPGATGSLGATGTAGATSTITIGPTNPNSGLSSNSTSEDSAPYTVCIIETTTVYDTGNVQMPGTGVGSLGSVSSIVKAHGGMMQLFTTWVMMRPGAPPQYPTFEPIDPNIVPLRGTVVMESVDASPDGQSLVYSGSGYYWHAVLNPNIYEMVPAVPPFYGSEVREAATIGAAFWTNAITWGIRGQNGSNPFVLGGVTPGIPPQLPQGFDQSGTGEDTFQQATQFDSQQEGSGSYFVPNVR